MQEMLSPLADRSVVARRLNPFLRRIVTTSGDRARLYTPYIRRVLRDGAVAGKLS